MRASRSCCRSRPPTATQRCSTARTRWCWTANATGTWPSASASTAAWARTWPGWSCAPRSSASCTGSRRSPWRTRPRSPGPPARSTGPAPCLSPSDPVRFRAVSDTTYTLAGSDVTIPALGVGTWAWGDKSTWGYGAYDSSLTEDTIRDAWQASIDAGATFFDTAEVYGKGESERIIGRLLAEDPERAKQIQLATKFMPSPWKVNVKGALMSSLRNSLDRLGLPAADLYQIHGPVSLRGHGAIAEALATAHQAGLV